MKQLTEGCSKDAFSRAATTASAELLALRHLTREGTEAYTCINLALTNVGHACLAVDEYEKPLSVAGQFAAIRKVVDGEQ